MNTQNNLQKISNDDLDLNLKSLVKHERELLSEILEHIAEVDRRKLYLKLSYPNLFEYLTKHLGYSNGHAQRRLEAARLLQEVPVLTSHLESGKLQLSQVALVQKSIRQQKKETKTNLSKEQKRELLENLLEKSQAESEVIVAKTLNIELKQAPQVHHQQDESVRFEITFSKQQWAKLQEMRELLSTSLPIGSWDEVLEYVADKVIAQKKKEPKKVMARQTSSQNDRSIPATVRRFILKRDKCCQHRDPKSNKQCASKWNLQVDHIKPVWAGGTGEPENLRALCAAHNRQRYKDQAGIH